MRVWLLVLYYTLAQESNNIGENQDPANCVCDLTANSCDLFCCCDTSCDSALVSSWDASRPEKNLCVPAKLSTWGQQYCVKKNGEYIENDVHGETLARDTVNTLLCVEVDNSPTMGRFYDVVALNDVSEDVVAALEDKTVDYGDSFAAPTEHSFPTSDTFQTGDYILSKINSTLQPGNIWPIPSPDAFGRCSNMNPARWLFSQDLPPCTLTAVGCDERLNPMTYTISLRIANSPSLGNNATPLSVNVQNVWDLKQDGSLTPASEADLKLYNCSCNGIIYEAHYTVVTDATQQNINSVYADVFVGSPQTCTEVTQKFSLNFVSAEATSPLSGNPGYIVGKPLLMKKNETSVLSPFQLGGVKRDGSCANAGTSYLLHSSPIVSFRSETILSCYVECNFADLKNRCGSFNFNGRDFLIFSNLPSFVGMFGNAQTPNLDDFLPLKLPTTVSNQWNTNTNDCTVQNTLVLEFTTAEVGLSSNPQPKIIDARAYFRNNTTWRHRKQDKTETQRFFNNIVVTFVRYQESTDPYKTVDSTAEDALIDDVIYPWKANHAKRVAAALLACAVIFA